MVYNIIQYVFRGDSMDKANCVMVKVKGIQRDAAGEVNTIKTTAKGRYFFRGGKHYVLYDDCSLNKEKRTSTVLQFNLESLTLLRKGAVESEQRFLPGKEHHTRYRTPYGELELSAKTSKLKVLFDSTNGGAIDVSYDMSINGKFQSQNQLHIEIRNIVKDKP